MSAGGGDPRDCERNVSVKNTFINFQEEDPWAIKPEDLRREQTDSVVERSRHSSLAENAGSWLTQPKAGGAASWPSRRQKTPQDEPEPIPGDNAPGHATGSTCGASSVVGWISGEAVGAAGDLEPQHEGAPAVAASGSASAAPAGQGLFGKTTVMLRHIPVKLTQRKLMREINSAGFLGRYDFIYLPMDQRSRANRGFAFCNFETPETAMLFFEVFHGKKFRFCEKDRGNGEDAEKDVPLEVLAADIQGFEGNAEHYVTACATRRSRHSHSRPLLLRPLPPHLAHHSGAAFVDQQIGPCAADVGADSRQSKALAASGPSHQGAASSSGDPSAAAGGARGGRGGAAAAAGTSSAPPAQDSAQGSRPVQPRFCPYCGKPKQADFAFCPYCGQKVPEPQGSGPPAGLLSF